MEGLEKRELRKKLLLNCGWKFVYGYREQDETLDKKDWSDVGLPQFFWDTLFYGK